VAALAALAGSAVYVLNQERSRNVLITSLKGVPIVVPIVVVLLVVLTFVLKRTGYGLHIYAVGGNREAARRAGHQHRPIRISAFMICSTMAAIGGILTASRANSVDANTGGSNVLLYAVGARSSAAPACSAARAHSRRRPRRRRGGGHRQRHGALMGYSSVVNHRPTCSACWRAGVDALSRRRATPLPYASHDASDQGERDRIRAGRQEEIPTTTSARCCAMSTGQGTTSRPSSTRAWG
jgi:D-xylose transport system permease protein